MAKTGRHPHYIGTARYRKSLRRKDFARHGTEKSWHGTAFGGNSLSDRSFVMQRRDVLCCNRSDVFCCTTP